MVKPAKWVFGRENVQNERFSSNNSWKYRHINKTSRIDPRGEAP
ncbi:hypothetical protein FHS27_004850 [Rhodopirellula rubra]|uniref:Uncharacterized protein n=1 Tax=Aporhodopirellula rubra TaxID=980271 RepID=A0A7W5E3D7_9BACT|nr:hypothetical protein RRSWK_05439 [Rhodopirellula sp. SWK7]MBB3209014.1 hypothetical protein [Aporhodopirellula rubra]